jgi:anthraniloyl-CoA monooxygenase
VTAGGTVADERPPYRRRYLVDLADMVRNEVPVPVMVGGAITTFDDVDTLVVAGKADLCLLDPYLYQGS